MKVGHTLYVCTLHQNTKLMMLDAKLAIIPGGQFSHYRHCLSAIQCNPPHTECYLGQCEECPGADKLEKTLDHFFDDQMIDQIQYKQ